MVQEQAQEVNREMLNFPGRHMLSGDRSPLLEFTGVLTGWSHENSVNSFRGTPEVKILYYFENVQVLRQREDYPAHVLDTAEVPFKWSTAKRSIYGFMLDSMATALGLPFHEISVDGHLVGKHWHFKTEQYNWGRIPNATNADENGDVWGEIWKAELLTAPAAAVAAQIAAPVAAAPVVAQPVVQPVAQPVAAVPVAAPTALDVAKNLLNGRSKSEFLPVVLANPVIQQDLPLYAQMSGQMDLWLNQMVGSGEFQMDANEKYIRVAPVVA